MQSHCAEFPAVPMKAFGHKRRPSQGSISVTALLLNMSPPSEVKSYDTLSGDGLTPEGEKQIMCFPIKQKDGELVRKNDSGAEKYGESNNNESEDYSVKTHGNEGQAPCVKCPKSSSLNCSAIDELCSKLCSSECNKIPSIKLDENEENDRVSDGKEEVPENVKLPSTIEQQRRKFLTDILCNSEEEDDACVEVASMENMGFPRVAMNPDEFREKFAIADALAKTSMMTSPAAKRRIAARKIEIERDYYNSSPTGSDDEQFVPPRELLLYLVRMGSFNSAPRINNSDSQDDSLEIPKGLTMNDLLRHCKIMRGEHLPQLLQRYFLKPVDHASLIYTDITEGVRVLQLNAISKVCSNPISSPKQLRIFQWNILSQTLGQNNDGFVQCPDEALTWENRKYLIVEEIIRNHPDVICLQEVDHFKFLERVLGSQNYSGVFFPKPDSPCLYIEENNGPDGCAIFYRRDKFEMVNFNTRILEVWRVQSNQVAVVANLRVLETGKEVSVCTTHLKARNGALLSKLRNEQGKDLLKFLNEVAEGRPAILCGDFNAEPIEPVYSTVLNHNSMALASAYAEIAAKEKGQQIINDSTDQSESKENDTYTRTPAEISASLEPPYTTWKIREEGEVCHTIDYVFYTTQNLKVLNCLSFPEGTDIGETRTPSFQYPSDHFALVCDFEIVDD